MDMLMMFTCIQPPCEGKRPFEKDYFLMSRMAIKSLIKTGYPSDKILCISSDEEHSERLEKDFKIQVITHANMPDAYVDLMTRIPKKYFFYKPVAFKHCMPTPMSSDTLMCFCDVDAVWRKNPRKYFKRIPTDVWAPEGVVLPRKRSKKIRADRKINREWVPKMTYDDLKKFYYKSGGGGIAHLHMSYQWPLQRQVLYSNVVCINPSVYEQLIDRWYEMSTIVVQRDDMEKSDQEVLSAAIWSLGLSHSRAPRGEFRNKYCMQYETRYKDRMKKEYTKQYGKIPV